ncbi:MAG TPA: glycosyltransferase family 39 protein [Planctomycetota bacterium]|nr:glycosyltransferase family 39 protein [Planctomycetota bacterium]
MQRWAVPAAMVVLFVGMLFIHIGRPFLRHREMVASQYAIMARNHVRLGLAKTCLASYEVSAPDLSVYPYWREYCYPNRPFLSVLITSLWFRLFGDGEAVLRLSLMLAALGSIVAFWKLAERIVDARWVVLATALFAFNPMFWYFSIVAVHLTYALTFSLAAWACRVRWDEGRRFRVLTVVFLFLACETDWPGYYAALSLALDALLQKRRLEAAGLFGVGVGTFGLHVLHLLWIDPDHGPFVRRLLSAGVQRSAQGLPGPFAFVAGEAREFALYFTVGMVLLALAGFRRLPRRVWLLALLGLDEILFMRWSHHHDYLSYPLAAFFALAAVKGVESLWSTPRRKLAAQALLALAAVQALWITGVRLTREGAYEVNYRAGLAIHEAAKPDDRVLITVADERQLTPYYADRFTGGVEPGEPALMIHPSGGRYPAETVDDLERYFLDFTLVLVGDPERAASEIAFFKGKRPIEEFRFLGPEHPLRRKLEAVALSKTVVGAFIFYRLR